MKTAKLLQWTESVKDNLTLSLEIQKCRFEFDQACAWWAKFLSLINYLNTEQNIERCPVHCTSLIDLFLGLLTNLKRCSSLEKQAGGAIISISILSVRMYRIEFLVLWLSWYCVSKAIRGVSDGQSTKSLPRVELSCLQFLVSNRLQCQIVLDHFEM